MAYSHKQSHMKSDNNSLASECMVCLLDRGITLDILSSVFNVQSRGDRSKMIHFFKIFFSCFYDWIYLIAFKCIMHCQVLATT